MRSLQTHPRDTLPAMGAIAIRWNEARLSSLASFHKGSGVCNEVDLLAGIEASLKESVLRAVFDASRRCGSEIVREAGRPLIANEISEAVYLSKLSCFSNAWRSEDAGASLSLRREGCAQKAGCFGCDYFREAADGLVMGLGDDARYARHLSLGHGNDECLDFIYSAEHKHRQFGAIAAFVEQAAQTIREDLLKLGAEFKLIGFSEGVLFYSLEGSKTPLCGAARALLTNQLLTKLKTAVAGVWKNTTFQDITPRPVLIQED